MVFLNLLPVNNHNLGKIMLLHLYQSFGNGLTHKTNAVIINTRYQNITRIQLNYIITLRCSPLSG